MAAGGFMRGRHTTQFTTAQGLIGSTSDCPLNFPEVRFPHNHAYDKYADNIYWIETSTQKQLALALF
jgi:hypothetical protein